MSVQSGVGERRLQVEGAEHASLTYCRNSKSLRMPTQGNWAWVAFIHAATGLPGRQDIGSITDEEIPVLETADHEAVLIR